MAAAWKRKQGFENMIPRSYEQLARVKYSSSAKFDAAKKLDTEETIAQSLMVW